jgi:hypothetical protein
MTSPHIPVATDRRSHAFAVGPLQPAAVAPAEKEWLGWGEDLRRPPARSWPPRGAQFALASGRTVTILGHLRGGCVECAYEDGERVGLTLKFLRKFGRAA